MAKIRVSVQEINVGQCYVLWRHWDTTVCVCVSGCSRLCSSFSPGETGARGLTGDNGDLGVKGERGQQGECAVAPRSAFSAKLSEGHTLPLTVGDSLCFDKILLNEQGDYSTETGRFTCKVPGVYYFCVHATVYRASLQFDLMKNGHTVASYFQYYGNWPKPGSLSGGSLLHLVPGDQVWVQMALSEYNGFYSSTKTDSTFTGFLVYSEWKNSAVFAWHVLMNKTKSLSSVGNESQPFYKIPNWDFLDNVKWIGSDVPQLYLCMK